MTAIEQETISDIQWKIGRLQTLHKEVADALRLLIDERFPMKEAIGDYLARNYRRAFDNTKKNAGRDSLELWCASDIREKNVKFYDTQGNQFDFNYGRYVALGEKIHDMLKILDSYQTDISACQSRINAMKIE